MKIIKPQYVIEDRLNGYEILKKIEKAGRTCYKSEDKITDESCKAFVQKIIGMGHESVLEHEKLSIRFICDRGVTHELVRHRIASYSQESTRYCNYGKDKYENQVTFIEPCFWGNNEETGNKYGIWREALASAEKAYLQLIAMGASPQEARSVLPNSLKTEIVMTANLREWREVFRQRTSKRAHPQMRELMVPLLKELQEKIPIIFDDIVVEES